MNFNKHTIATGIAVSLTLCVGSVYRQTPKHRRDGQQGSKAGHTELRLFG